MRIILSACSACVSFFTGVCLSGLFIQQPTAIVLPPTVSAVLADDIPLGQTVHIDPPFNREIEKYGVYSVLLTEYFGKNENDLLVIRKEVGCRNAPEGPSVEIELETLENDQISLISGLKRETYENYKARVSCFLYRSYRFVS